MDYVSLKAENHIGIVTINKLPANSFNRQLFQEVKDTFLSIDANKDIWVVVLRTEGKHFSTGNDVNNLTEFTDITDSQSAREYAKFASESICSVYKCGVPVIGAVRGMTLGAGLALASCCDILIASENTRFGLPEVMIGVVAAACFISRMVPQQLHRYMSFSGDIMTAEQMKHYGAVLKVVADEQLFTSAMEVATRLANNPPLALRGFKTAMNANENARLEEKYALEISCSIEFMLDTEDFKEAISAFLKKRKPVYNAR